jgi:hypothetical protein
MVTSPSEDLMPGVHRPNLGITVHSWQSEGQKGKIQP